MRRLLRLSVVCLQLALSGCLGPSLEEVARPVDSSGIVSFAELALPAATIDASQIVTAPVDLVQPPVSDRELGCALPAGASLGDGWHLVEEEFPQSLWFINKIEADPAGGMWLATDGLGASYFDGAQWIIHQPESRNDVRGDTFRGFAVAHDYVYAGEFGSHAGGGVMIYDKAADRWQDYWPGESPLSGGGVGGIGVDEKSGLVYLPTMGGSGGSRLDIYQNGAWTQVSNPAAATSFYDGLVDDQGRYWLATSAGVWRYAADDGWTRFAVDTGGLLANDTPALAIDSHGTIWAASAAGITAIGADGSRFYPRDQFPLGSFWEVDIAVDAQDRVWFVTREVVSVFNGSQWATMPAASVGLDGWGGAIGIDEFGCAWVEVGLRGVAILTREIALGRGD